MGERLSQADHRSKLRNLGVTDLFAIGYGDLGSSIFYALAITAMHALGATPIALLLAGVVFSCTALTYAEMSAIIPESGGSASFSRKSFNDLISFVAGWGLLLDYIVTIAISSFSIAPYLSYFLPSLAARDMRIFSTFIVISLIFVLNLVGTKHSTKISFCLMSVALLTQIVLIGLGFYSIEDYHSFFVHLRIGDTTSLYSPTWEEFFKGLAMAMVAYTGIESMSQLAAEAKEPAKTVPRAIVIVMVVLILLYLGVSMVTLSLVPPVELYQHYLDNPMMAIVQKLQIGRAFLTPWVSVLAAMLLFVAANAGLIGASRLAFNLGEYFQLPKFFYSLHPRFQTPHRALCLFSLFAVLIVIWSDGKLGFLADLYNFGAMLAFFMAHLSLIRLRMKEPELQRPFRLAPNMRLFQREIPLPAVIGAISTFLVFCSILFNKPEGRNLGLLWFSIGIAMYIWYRRRHHLELTGSLEINRVSLEHFHPFEVKKILVVSQDDPEAEAIQLGCMIAQSAKASLDLCRFVLLPFYPSGQRLLFLEKQAQVELDRDQAIALEKGVAAKTVLLRSRFCEESLVELTEQSDYDLLILSIPRQLDFRQARGIQIRYQEVIQRTRCRVLVCECKS